MVDGPVDGIDDKSVERQVEVLKRLQRLRTLVCPVSSMLRSSLLYMET